MRTSVKICLFSQFLSLLGIFLLSGIAVANPEAENLFNSGLAHYEDQKYNKAIKELEDAVQLEPENARYHHVLAKSYGLEAKRTNWFRAMSLARKTLTHLELAAKLDNDNIEILDDLMEFYREAPGFLGGDTEKANKIQSLIEKLTHEGQQTAKIE